MADNSTIRLIPACRVSVDGKKLAIDLDARLTRVEVDLDVDLFGQCLLVFNDPAQKLINGKEFQSGTPVRAGRPSRWKSGSARSWRRSSRARWWRWSRSSNNATPAFDRDPVAATSFAPDPFILMNLVLVHVRLDSDDVQLHQTLAAVANGGGIFASSGVFSVLAQPNNTALHHNARCTIIGGGRNGRLGTDRVFGGWMQDAVLAIGHRGTYVDNTVAPPVPHPLITVQENPRRGALTGCLGQSTITSRNNANHGEQLRIQAVDSPAMPYPAAHPGFPAALLTFFHFEMRFRAVMAFWTNNANPPNGATSGDPAERR